MAKKFSSLFSVNTKNLGSKDSIAGTIYARGSNIDNVFRLVHGCFHSGKLNIALEIEYTAATMVRQMVIQKVV